MSCFGLNGNDGEFFRVEREGAVDWLCGFWTPRRRQDVWSQRPEGLNRNGVFPDSPSGDLAFPAADGEWFPPAFSRSPDWPDQSSLDSGPKARPDSRTRCSMTLPGLKDTTNFSGTSTFWPVFGLRARRAARDLTSNTPKFLNSIRPSRTSVSIIESKVRWTTSLVSCWVRPSSSDMTRTMSFLVTRISSSHRTTPGRIAFNDANRCRHST